MNIVRYALNDILENINNIDFNLFDKREIVLLFKELYKRVKDLEDENKRLSDFLMEVLEND